MIDAAQVVGMIEHWLSVPAYHYFGTDYGHINHKLLLNPLSASVADEYLAKMKRDIPILQSIPSNQLNIVATTEGYSTRMISIQLGSVLIAVGEPSKQQPDPTSENTSAYTF